jgi:hypothetical protein
MIWMTRRAALLLVVLAGCTASETPRAVVAEKPAAAPVDEVPAPPEPTRQEPPGPPPKYYHSPPARFDPCEPEPYLCKEGSNPMHRWRCTFEHDGRTFTARAKDPCGDLQALSAIRRQLCAAKLTIRPEEWSGDGGLYCRETIDPCMAKLFSGANDPPNCPEHLHLQRCTVTTNGRSHRTEAKGCGQGEAAYQALMAELCAAGLVLEPWEKPECVRLDPA